MLKRVFLNLQKPSARVLNGTLRFQSTSVRTELTGKSVEPKLDDLTSEDLLNEKEVGDLSSLSQLQESFTVFPNIENVKPEELVGAAPFGLKTYFVERSATGNLPVYSEYKRNGRPVTEIRKIQGDPVQLRNDLQERLPHIPKRLSKSLCNQRK